MKSVYRWGCGRTATFALFLLVAGIGLAATKHLDGAFVGLAGIIQALVTFRAVSDDHRKRRDDWHKDDAPQPTGLARA